jgi:TfoX N-terminal domain
MCFMVNDKMCVCVSADKIMCRVGPEAYEEALEKNDCGPMIHRGRTMKGFVFVSEDVLKTKKELSYRVQLCLTSIKLQRKRRKNNDPIQTRLLPGPRIHPGP